MRLAWNLETEIPIREISGRETQLFAFFTYYFTLVWVLTIIIDLRQQSQAQQLERINLRVRETKNKMDAILKRNYAKNGISGGRLE